MLCEYSVGIRNPHLAMIEALRQCYVKLLTHFLFSSVLLPCTNSMCEREIHIGYDLSSSHVSMCVSFFCHLNGIFSLLFLQLFAL